MPGPKIVAGKNEMTPTERAQVKKALNWLRNWYTERAKMTNKYGVPLISEQELKAGLERLEKAEIYFGTQSLDKLEQNLADGRYAVTKEGLKHFEEGVTEEEFHEAFMIAMRGKDQDGLRGVSTHANMDPGIVYLDDKQNRRPERMNFVDDNHVPYGLEKVKMDMGVLMAHEGTHALGLAKQEEKVENIVFSQYMGNIVAPYDQYLDEGTEIYARLNQFRYQHGIDPHKVFTLEEVSQMRLECISGMVDYLNKLDDAKQQQEKTGSALLPELPVGDALLFERYDDKVLMNLLNNTAQLDRGKGLDELHREGLDRQVDDRLFAQRENTAELDRMRETNRGMAGDIQMEEKYTRHAGIGV